MTVTGTVTIGVLALQGAFQEHIDMVKSIGHHAVAIRLPGQLKDLDGLILPGGESTTMAILLEKWSFVRLSFDVECSPCAMRNSISRRYGRCESGFKRLKSPFGEPAPD